MRLIDADALIKALNDYGLSYRADINVMIMNAPTIEPSGDLISRADAIRWVKTECNPYGKPTLDYDSGLKVIEHLKNMPSAESEQIVYCMECAKSVPLDEYGALWYCNAHDRTTLRHSYCNNGERKGGDDE